MQVEILIPIKAIMSLYGIERLWNQTKPNTKGTTKWNVEIKFSL